MTDVRLTPELEQFAEACVASGAYESVSAVAQAGLLMLQKRERAKAELLASVIDAEVEAERDGCFSAEEMIADLEELFAEIEAERN